MAHLSQIELENWIALYAATGLCCAIAVVLSVTVLSVQLYRERPLLAAPRFHAALWLVPKTWWRWQKLYFMSFPVTFGIVLWFGATLSWS